MPLNLIRFLSLLFTGLALAPALAHLLELPAKIKLTRDSYLTVQQIYRGWALLGIVIFIALLATLTHAVAARRRRREFMAALAAFLLLAGTQGIFWTFTFPANRATANWTQLPEHWETLRSRWEYSHAASAMFNLGAFMSVIAAVLSRDPRRIE